MSEVRKMVKCQNCDFLEKLPYALAYPTHHENWRCKKQGITLQYEFTCAEIECSRYREKERGI